MTMTVFKNLLLPMELMEWMVRRFSELDCPDFLKSRGFGGNFGWFLGGMFVFGSILTIYVNQMRKFWEKGGKNVRKNDGKVRKKYTFVRKKYKNIRILDIGLARLCAPLAHSSWFIVGSSSRVIRCLVARDARIS